MKSKKKIRKTEMHLVVTWNGKTAFDIRKSFYNKMDGYRELLWVFRSALDVYDGKMTHDEATTRPKK